MTGRWAITSGSDKPDGHEYLAVENTAVALVEICADASPAWPPVTFASFSVFDHAAKGRSRGWLSHAGRHQYPARSNRRLGFFIEV